MNEIVKFTSDNGSEVSFTAQDVKDRLCPNLSDQELAFVMALCQQQKLDPFIKDVHVVKYGNQPAQIITGKEVFSKRANANPNYEGFEAGVTVLSNGNIVHREGSAVYKEADEKLLGGWCRVYVKGKKPFYDEVTLAEYSTGKALWQSKPATMIRKVAYVHCLREAFPESFQGLYTPEEMGTNGDTVLALGKNNNDTLETITEPIRSDYEIIEEVLEMPGSDEAEKLDKLTLLIGEFASLRGRSFDDVVYAIFNSKAFADKGFKELGELDYESLVSACALLDSWIEKAKKDSKPKQDVKQESLASEDIEF